MTATILDAPLSALFSPHLSHLIHGPKPRMKTVVSVSTPCADSSNNSNGLRLVLPVQKPPLHHCSQDEGKHMQQESHFQSQSLPSAYDQDPQFSISSSSAQNFLFTDLSPSHPPPQDQFALDSDHLTNSPLPSHGFDVPFHNGFSASDSTFRSYSASSSNTDLIMTPTPTTNGNFVDSIPHTMEKDLPDGGNWVVQKFGGTSVGKFPINIADIVA